MQDLSSLLEKILPWFRPLLRWLNPRTYPWNLPILIGIVMGMVLMLGEVPGEGGGSHQIGRFLMVAAVFLGLECIAVPLGYALLASPLGLFRHDADDKITRRAYSQNR